MPDDEIQNATPPGDAAAQPADDAAEQPAADAAEQPADGDAPADDAVPAPAEPSRGIPVAVVVLAAIVPAAIVGVLVWLLASSSSGSGGTRTNADVSSIVAAFSQGSNVTRFEGQLPPGFPKGVPTYPGAQLLSSLLQINGNDVAFLAVYDTSDKRATVSAYFDKQLAADPWQIDLTHDGLDSTIHQFTKIDDANIAGLVLAGESKHDSVTTIIYSVQVTAGAAAIARPAFSPPVSKALPAGYPGDTLPQYAGSTVIEAGFQKQPGTTAYQVSFITKDDVATVVSYYKNLLNKANLTVADGDTSQATLKNAQAVTFTDAAKTLGGQVLAGTFAADEAYTRIDVQVTAKPAGQAQPTPAAGQPQATPAQ